MPLSSTCAENAAAQVHSSTEAEASDLAILRAQIDVLDQELLTLLNQRAALSLKVGNLKANSAGPVFRPQREQAILNSLMQSNQGPLPNTHLKTIWKEIFASSRTLQRPLQVAYLGPEGTHSYFAAVNFLGQLTEYYPCRDFREVFSAVANGHCALAVVPLENLLHGTVGQCIDLFMEFEVWIQAEFVNKIEHCLLSGEPSVTTVRTVYSHPQALAQCQRWLRNHLPDAELVPVESTAAAARRSKNEPGTASIGHSSLSNLLELPILAQNLEDEPDNQTRFVVIGRTPSDTALANRTSILFTTPDKPGALALVLDLLARHSINIRKLESRPLHTERWKYIFFADLEANLGNPELAPVEKELRTVCHSIRLLGCYAEV